MTKTKNILIWVLAFVLMGVIVVYQRMTGPTHPKRGKVTILGEEIKYKLPRSHDGSGKELIEINAPNKSIQGKIRLKRYKSYDEWSEYEMERKGSSLFADIPEQPPAGKVMYDIMLGDGNTFQSLTKEPVIIRFKGVVPSLALIPHIIFMFFAMVISTRAGLEALFKGNNTYMLSVWTLITLGIGGLFLGPVVQQYAFGAFWTGWPFGHDLTDNKTLAAFIMWAVAAWRLKKNPNARGWALAAALVMLAVYLIPHSVLGSEIDYTKIQE